MGQRAIKETHYITRNAVFETNLPGSGTESCLKNIETAFRFGKPAIISNHRASFVGGINKSNRKDGLRQLDLLFTLILKLWPDVEFIDMEELAKTISSP